MNTQEKTFRYHKLFVPLLTATFTLEQYDLNVIVDGTGSGSVTSDPSGIDCGSDCAETFDYGTVVTLMAVANTNSTFTGWSGGGCSGTGDCVVTMTAGTAVTATFTIDEYFVYLPVVLKP